ncbi:hypothetical protein JHK85_050792 [Glycine max]|nr:hypothetical protein JHK85_050792 [Glycine max]
MIRNFKVVKNDSQYRICAHPYKLIFIGVTVIREIDLVDVPLSVICWLDGDVDLNASPEALSKILGYTLAVKAPCKVHFPLSDANNPPQYETDEKKTYHAAKLEYSISLPSQVYTLLHKTK